MKIRNKFRNTALLAVSISIGTFLGACKNDGGNDASSFDRKKGFSNDAEKASYALGVNIGNSLDQQDMDSIDPFILAQAIADKRNEKELLVPQDSAQPVIREYMQKVQDRKRQANIEEGKAFLEEEAEKEDVKETASGLQYKVIEEGSGPKPDKWDSVRVHYEGRKIGGEVFDSSIDKGQPAEFSVQGGVVQGWTEALQMMKEGAEWKIHLPHQLAYGERGRGQKIGPGETLIFDIELLEVIEVDSAEAAQSQQGQGQKLSPAQRRQLQQRMQQRRGR